MKVSIITRHAITNYGSLLQALATQIIVERLGYESEIIDYIREDETYYKHEITLLKRKPEWYNNPLKRLLYLVLRQPESIISGLKFAQERKKYLKLSGKYDTLEALKTNTPVADVYLTGSDQVWGPMENGEYDSAYCLSFVENKRKKVAYAASFGHTEMTNEKEQYFKKWLSRYSYLAVREDSAVNILHSMGLNAEQVVDPTLLLTKKDWSKYIGRTFEEPYILVYQLHNDKRLGEYAEKVARKKRMKLIRLSASMHQINRPGKFIWCPKMAEFLSLINNATCMITDSFHGTAFAINFNTQFIEVLPNNNTGTRNMSILRLTGLEDRILQDENDLSLIEQRIDFTYANEVLDAQRRYSIDVLNAMLKN